MVHILYRPNLLDRSKDSLSYEGNCRTVREALLARFGTVDFTSPTYVEVNGTPWLRGQWDTPLPPNVSITVNVVPAEVTTAVLVAVTISSLLLTAYALVKVNQLASLADAVGAGVPEKAPVFTFEGQKNIQRLNNVVDTVYGRLRWWPAYLCAPYVDYVNNKPILHMWLSLGKGNYEIEDVRVNDTSLSSIGKAYYTQYDSGYVSQPTDDYDLVYYAKDFSGTELTGTNEEEHAVLGPYLLNPANTKVDTVKVNFAYASGLYAVNDVGVIQDATCATSITLTEIDDSGATTGQYQTFSITHTKSLTTAYRITETLVPGEQFTTGRYAISAVRTNAKNKSTNGQDQCTIETAFALGHSLRTFTSSLLYVRLPGTNVVGQDAAEKINVTATRKLRTRVGGAWTSLVATRNPVWAMLDILQQPFGAGLPDSSLDLPYWEEMAKELSAYTFDYRFEQKTTVWDALSVVATVFRGKPYWIGSDIRISMDTAVRTPVCVFTPDSAKELRLHMAFQTSTENDCIEAAYVDPDTGLQDSVYFTPPGSEAVNPTKITFAGVTDRETAWRLAAYTYLQKTVIRDTVSLSTGLDGKIPMLGEVILVSWPLPSWTSAGIVLAYDGATRLELSETVPYAEGWITLRSNDGNKWGPVRYVLEAELSADGNPVVSLEYAPEASFDFTAIVRDSVAYTIGQADTITRRFQVTSANPSGDTVQVEGVEFDPAVFSYDNLSVPSRGDDMLPYPSVSGPIPWLRVLEESGQYFRLEVGPIYGTPTSVVCSYAYVLESVLVADALSAPWAYVGSRLIYPVQEAAKYGASYYIPRQAGTVVDGALADPYVLFARVDVTLAGGAVYTTWHRSRPGQYSGDELRCAHLYLVNNIDLSYGGPGSPLNEASPASQATLKTTTSAVFDVNEAKLVVATDCPPGGSAEVRVESGVLVGEVFTVEHSASKRVKDVGPVIFTAEDIRSAGMQGTETSYPDLRIVVDHVVDGEPGAAPIVVPLIVYPMVSDPIPQTVSQQRVSVDKYAPVVHAIVPNTLGDGSYVDFGGIYLCDSLHTSLLQGYSGAARNKFTFYSQHEDSSNYTEVGNTSTNSAVCLHNIVAYPFLRKIGVSPVEYEMYKLGQSIVDTITVDPNTGYPGINYAVFGVPVDADYNLLIPGRVLLILPSGASRISTWADGHVGITEDIRMLYNKGETVLDNLGSRVLTDEEYAVLQQSYAIVLCSQSRMPIPTSTSHVGLGGVKCTQYDMFGHAGNTTPGWGSVVP